MQTHELFLSHGHTDTDNMAFQLSISASVRECARWVWHILIAAAYVRIQFENRFTRVPTHTFVCCFLASPQFTIHVQCDSQRQYSLCSIYFFVRNFSFPLAGTLLACSLSFVWMKLRQILFFRTYTHTHTCTHSSVFIFVLWSLSFDAWIPILSLKAAKKHFCLSWTLKSNYVISEMLWTQNNHLY